ncbi:MAG TPA: SMC-Scp complex subunit ScpB [Silvibacterium sp.]|nr:SMC-Scp complex subunit ScpB [Silvibacterium sp.]
MSLKAKIEAVIYAAEEPVTLAQIASLFQGELAEEREARLGAETPGQEEFAAESPLVAEAAVVSDPGEALPQDEKSSEKTAAEDEKRAARQRDREIRDEARRLISQLVEEYREGDRGVEIREIAGGYRVATKPEYHDAVRGFIKSLKPPMKLSLQALETLAVIAYKQPVTAPEVSEIRGVDSSGVLGSLGSRKLITTAGRKQVIGRPILYKTTKEFLLRFGLKDVNELPSIEEFEKMAGELADTDDAVPESELLLEDDQSEEQAIASGEGEISESEGEAERAQEGNG